VPLEVDKDGDSDDSLGSSSGEAGEAGAGSTGISPHLAKLNYDLDVEQKKVESERKRAGGEPESPGPAGGESDEKRLERLRDKRDKKVSVTVLDPTEVINKKLAGAISQARVAHNLAAASMKLSERELDRIAKESLKVVSNKGMDWASWQTKIKDLRELQFHENLIEFRTVKKGDKEVSYVETQILNIVPHGKTVYMRMQKPEDRQELQKKILPLLAKLDCHLMTPSSDSKECMLSPSRACYKFVTKNLLKDQVKGHFFTEGPEDLTKPHWSLSFDGEVLIKCVTEPYSEWEGMVSRIRLLNPMPLYGKNLDLEALIKAVREDMGRFAPQYPFELIFVYAKGPLSVAPAKGKGKGKSK